MHPQWVDTPDGNRVALGASGSDFAAGFRSDLDPTERALTGDDA